MNQALPFEQRENVRWSARNLQPTSGTLPKSGLLPHIDRSPGCQLFRSGTHVQAAHTFSDSACPQQGPLAPSCFQDFPATMGLSDSRPRQTSRLFIPGFPPALSPSRSGPPRFLGASFRARSSQPPRGALQVLILVASLQMAGFIISGSLIAPNQRNEAEMDTGPLPALGYPPPGGRRYMANEQLPWLTPFSQQDAPGFAWRFQSPLRTQRMACQSGRHPYSSLLYLFFPCQL